MIETLRLSDIIKDSDLQMRVAMNEQAVADYAEVIRNTPVGEPVALPPVVAFRDKKKLYLVDGFHRHEGHVRAGAADIQAEVIAGTKRDAVLYSVGANASHGLRRTNEDKRKAVLTLLNDREWAVWSDREISRRSGVSNTFVSNLRAGLVSTVDSPKTSTPASTPSDARSTKVEEQAANDRVREEARAALPDSIRQMEDAKASAIAARKSDEPTVGLSPEDQIAELQAANASLEAEITRLAEENKLFGEMKAEWENGGFAEVIAGKDEVIQSQARRLESESHEKVKNLRSADYWRQEAVKLGWSANEVIDLGAKVAVNG